MVLLRWGLHEVGPESIEILLNVGPTRRQETPSHSPSQRLLLLLPTRGLLAVYLRLLPWVVAAAATAALGSSACPHAAAYSIRNGSSCC